MPQPGPRVGLSSRGRATRVPCGALVAALLTAASCGGGNGGNGNNGNGGQPQNAQSCGGTVPDAQVMANWVHRQTAHWAYFMPDNNWVPVESTNSLDVSSPIGDAIVEFVFAYGPLVPTTVAGVAPQIIQGYLIQANVEVWAADRCTLTLIRNHITYLG